MSKASKNNPLVYSTEHGRIYSDSSKPLNLCDGGENGKRTKNDGIVRVSRSTQGRKGKGVVIITGIPLDSGELKKLGKELKTKFGVGGSVKNGIIELQGDFREKIVSELNKYGWQVKLSGG